MGFFSKLKGLNQPEGGDQKAKKEKKSSEKKKKKHHRDKKSSSHNRDTSKGRRRRKKSQEPSQPPEVVHITKNRLQAVLSPIAREKPKAVTPEAAYMPQLQGIPSNEKLTFAEYLTGVRKKRVNSNEQAFPPGLVPAAFAKSTPATSQTPQAQSTERPKPKAPSPKVRDADTQTQTNPTPTTTVVTTATTTPASTAPSTPAPSNTTITVTTPPPVTIKNNKVSEEKETKQQEKSHKSPKQIEAEKMKHFVKLFIKRDLEDFESLYDKIKGYIPKNFTRHLFDENMDKCRYADILCMDQTRVTLEDCGSGSFIHANYVAHGTDKFILTQFPTFDTVFDFWHMIWQESISAIVNVMTTIEMKEYADPIGILPEPGKCRHIADGFTITFQKCIPSDTDEFKLYLYGLIHENEYRQLMWIQYTGWPEGKAPVKTEGVLQVLSLTRKLKKPFVFMSLAGAGRAGTFASLEIAHTFLHNTKPKRLNINDCIQKVREGRLHSLQTMHQYKFIYIVLIDHIMSCKKLREDLPEDIVEKYEKYRKETLSKFSEEEDKIVSNIIS